MKRTKLLSFWLLCVGCLLQEVHAGQLAGALEKLWMFDAYEIFQIWYNTRKEAGE